jgi:hypothetical protein
MQIDLLAHPLVIDHEHFEDLNWVFNHPGLSGPLRTDFEHLVQEHDWQRKRVVWVIYGSCHPDSVELLLSKVSETSTVIIAEAMQLGAYHLQAEQRHRLLGYIQDQKLKIIAGGDALQRAEKLVELIDIDSMDAWKPVLSVTTMQDHAADVRLFFKRIAELLNQKAMFKATNIQRSVMYLRNALINAPLAYEPDAFSQLKAAMQDRPGLIVSAGPSLNKQLTLLAENQDLFTILAVDTVWPILHANGIVPDAVLALDPLNVPSWPVNGLHEDTLLVADIGTSPQLVWSNHQNHVITSCHEVIMSMIDAIGGKAGRMGTGGSVATSAFNLGVHLGANPLVFIGQDLAHTDGKDHADGYAAERDEAEFKRRFELGYDVDGYYGGKVRTEHQLLFYKTWFEEQIRQLSDKLVINATEGGAQIAGTVQLPFAEVCREIRATSLRKTKLPSPGLTKVNPDHMKQLCDGLTRLLTRIESFRDLAERGMKSSRNVGKQPTTRQLRDIDKINQEIRNYCEMTKKVINAFNMADLERIRYQTHTRENLEKMSDAVKQYRALYQSIIRSASDALTDLRKIKKLYEQVDESGRFDPDFLGTVASTAPELASGVTK